MLSNQYNNPSFKKLQNEWYEKLKEDGFEEIEDTDSPRELLKAWHGQYFQIKHTPLNYQITEQYYYMAAQLLNYYCFPTQTEEDIWRYHSDGLSTRDIAGELKKKGIKTSKDAVNKVIRSLIEVMKWVEVNAEKRLSKLKKRRKRRS